MPSSRYIVSPSNVPNHKNHSIHTPVRSKHNNYLNTPKNNKSAQNGDVHITVSPHHHSTLSESDMTMKPSLIATQRYCNLTHPRIHNKSTNEYTLHNIWSTSIHELSSYGIGLMSYFKLLKYLCVIMFLLSLCCIPALVLNTVGSTIVNNYDIEQTMLGNFGNGLNSNITTIQWSFTDRFNNDTYTYTVSKKLAMLIEVSCDGLYCSIFLLGCVYTYYSIKKDANAYNASINTIAQYTVEIRNLPTLQYIAQCTGRSIDTIDLRTELQQFLEAKYGLIGDISIQYNDTNIIELYKQRGELKKLLLTAQINHDGSAVEKYTNELAEQTEQIKYQQAQHNKVPVLAYITFEYSVSVQNILTRYPSSYLTWLFMPNTDRFYNYRIKIRHAPEPSNINYNNLAYTSSNRRIRRWISTLLTLIVLVLGTIFISIITYYQNQIPVPPVCNTKAYTNTDAAQININNFEQVTCYCSSLSDHELFASYSICKSYIASYALSKGLIIVTSITTVIINEIQYYGVNKIVSYEKHWSSSDQQRHIALKLFVGIFINTAVILLIVNADIPGLRNLRVIFNGEFIDFTPQWYKQVGLTIFLTHALTIITPQTLPLITYLYVLCKRRYTTELCTTQDQLNQLYSGTQFNLSQRYSMILVIIYVALFYSAGIPLLIPSTATILIISYWVDKYTFLRYYRIPPRYDESLSILCVAVLPYCIILHLAISCWFYSASNTDSYMIVIGQVNTYVAAIGSADQFHLVNRLQQLNVFPLFIYLCVLVLFYIGKSIVQLMILFYYTASNHTHIQVTTTNTITYSQAKQHHRFESYHLHLQEQYSIAYMVTTSKLQMQPELSLLHNNMDNNQGNLPINNTKVTQHSNKTKKHQRNQSSKPGHTKPFNDTKSINLSLLHRHMRAQVPQTTVFNNSVLMNHNEQSHINSDTYASHVNIRSEESVYTSNQHNDTHELNIPNSPAHSINQSSPIYARIRSIDTYTSAHSDASILHTEPSHIEPSNHKYGKYGNNRQSMGSVLPLTSLASYSTFNDTSQQNNSTISLNDQSLHNMINKPILKKTPKLNRMPSANVDSTKLAPTVPISHHKRSSTALTRHSSHATQNNNNNNQSRYVQPAQHSQDVLVASVRSYISHNEMSQSTVTLQSQHSHCTLPELTRNHTIDSDNSVASAAVDPMIDNTPVVLSRSIQPTNEPSLIAPLPPVMNRQFSMTLTRHDCTVAQLIVPPVDNTIVHSGQNNDIRLPISLSDTLTATIVNDDKTSNSEVNQPTVG